MTNEKVTKIGSFCPIRTPMEWKSDSRMHEQTCMENCAWFCRGINACIFFGINKNLQDVARRLKDIKQSPDAEQGGTVVDE